MEVKAVGGIDTVEARHETVARNLGDDRSRSDDGLALVAFHEYAVRNAFRQRETAVEPREAGPPIRRHPPDEAARRKVGGASDIDAINDRGTYPGDPPRN